MILGTGCSHPADLGLVDTPPPNYVEIEADYSPDGSALAFVYTSPTDLTQQAQLWKFTLADSALEMFGTGLAPSWAHDGRAIAYWYDNQLLVYDVNARATTSLWAPGNFARPTWSPGDRWIAVDRYFSDSLDGIWAHSTAGDSAAHLLSADVRFPQWSPDSSRIAFVLIDPNNDIAVLQLATGRIDTLTHSGDNRDPAWSKDGAWIAWSSQSPAGPRPHIWTMRSDGSSKQDLHVEGIGPTWSPDGSTIVFSGYDPARSAYLLTRMGRDGSKPVRLLGFWHGS